MVSPRAKRGNMCDQQRTLDQSRIVEVFFRPFRRRQVREIEIVVVQREVNAIEFAGEFGGERGLA